MDDRIVFANRAAEVLLGYAPGALVGRPLQDVIPARHRRAHREGMARYKATRVPVLIGRVVSVEALAADGTVVPVELSLSRPYASGADEIVVAVMRDMRERVPLDAALSARRDEQGLRAYLEDDASRRARLTADAVEAARLAALARLRVLADVGRSFSEGRPLQEALKRTAEVTAGAVGDWVLIYEADPLSGRMAVVATAHRDPAFANDMALLASLPGSVRLVGEHQGASDVVATGISQLYSPVRSEDELSYAGSTERLEVLRRVGLRSACVAPLKTASGVLGALVVGAGADAPLLSSEDLMFADQVADRIGAAMGRERLIERAAAQERRLAKILDELPEGVVIRHADGNVTANRAARDLAEGLQSWPQRGEWPFLGVLLEEDGQPTPLDDLPLPRALRGDVAQREYRVRRRDGLLRTILVNAAPISEPDGVAAVAVYHDISAERVAARRAERLVSMSRDLLEYNGTDPAEPLRRVVGELLDDLGEWCVFYLLNDEGYLERVAAFHVDPSQEELVEKYRLLSRRRWEDGVAGRPFSLEGDPIVVENVGDLLVRTEGSSDEERRALIEAVGVTAFMALPMVVERAPVGVLAVATTRPGGRSFSAADVAYLRAVGDRAAVAVRNAALVRTTRERADELSAVIRSDPSGLVLVDAKGRLRQLNDALLHLLGLFGRQVHSGGIEEVLQLYDAAGVADRDVVADRLRSLVSSPNERALLDLHFTKGPKPYVQLTTAPVLSREGELLGRLFVHVDVTQERELAQQRSDFLMLAAHELKTPLTPLTMQLSMLERRLGGSPKEHGMAKKALSQLDRVTALVEDLLQYAGVEAGRLTITKAPVDLNEVVSQVVEERRGSSANGHEVILQRSSGPLMVEMDRLRIEEVLLNLLQNAVKYSPGAGRIDVEVRAVGDEAVVSVKDRGIGIPRADRARVFDRFFRAKNAEAIHYSGLGIGLFVCSDIVRQHGGEIEVESTEGSGSTFSIRLPRVPSVTEPTEVRRRRILLVDDDRDILDVTSALLEEHGFDVDRAEDGLEALSSLRQGVSPDLILVDLMMPGLDGAGLLGQMRQEKLAEGVPRVLISASTHLTAAQRELDVQGALPKPFSLTELEAVIQRLVGAAQTEE